ncbi:MAG: GAF domain-containing protein [Candidatus Binatia bacterium]
MKILVADDDPINRKYLRTLLAHEGHAVVECGDGLATLAYLEHNPCDAVISDVLMPQMDGYRLCYEIRKNKKLKDTPIILYTASYLSAADEKAALAMGADKFIRKPAQPEVIISALDEVIENSRANGLERSKKPGNLSALREYSEVLVRKLEQTNIELSVANEALSENERRLRTIIESEPECVKVLARDGTVLEMNPAGLRMIEADSAGHVVGEKVYPLIVPEHRQAFKHLTEAAFQGESGTLEFEIVGLKGTRRWLDTHTVPLRNSNGEIVASLGITRDITEQKQNAGLLNDQMRVLEMIAGGAPLHATLDALLRAIEAQADDMFCSILLLDADGSCLRHGAAPRLPEEYSRRIDGAAIGEGVGSCGTAAFRGASVIVEDIAVDPLWQDYRDLALPHGLRACWSVPIFDAQRKVLGTFAVYFHEPGRPTEHHVRLVEIASHAAAIAINKHREEKSLRESETRFREMADSAPVMIWITRADGYCTYINRQWRDFTGQTEITALGFGWLDTVHPDDRRRIDDEFRKAICGHVSIRMEYRMRRRDGVYRWVIDTATPRKSDNGEFLGYIGSVFDFTEHKLAEEERQKNLERVRALHEINLAITSDMDLQSRLEVLLERIETFFPYAVVSSVRLLRPENGRLESLAFRGVDPEEWLKREPGRTLRRAVQVIDTKQPLIIDDVNDGSPAASGRGLAQLGLVSYAGIPLTVRDRVLGVLAVYTKERHKFDDEEIEFLTTLGGQAAIAIHNAQLYEEAERRRREAEELARIARSLTETLDMKAVGERVVASVLELFRVRGSSLRLRQPDGSMHRFAATGEVFSQTSAGVVVPAGVGLAGVAFAEGKAFWSADTLNDSRVEFDAVMREYTARSGNGSMIAVPLRVHDNPIGLLTLADRTGRNYSQGEVDLLQTFADQVALALQNARLYEQTERNLKRIEALHEIEKAITSTLDLQSVLQVLLEKIDIFLPFPAATTIRLLNRVTGTFDNTACRNIDEKEWKNRIGRGTRTRSGQLLKTKRPVIVPNIQEEPGVSATPFYRQHGFVSYLGVPLITKDAVVGILGFYTKSAHDFTQHEVDLLVTLAGQAAIAIDNAQLYEEIDRSKQQLETSNRSLADSLKQLESLYTALSPIETTVSTQELMSGIIDRLIEATGANAALIRLYDTNARKLPIVAHRGFSQSYLDRVEETPIGGAVEWVIEHDEPIIAPDIAAESRLRGKLQLQLGLRSCAILPVEVHGEVRGILHVASRGLKHYDEAQKNHLMAIARQMSIAMENRKLFDDVMASRDELARANNALSESNQMLSALHAVAAAASQSMDLSLVLSRTVEKITEIFSFEATRIHLYDGRTQLITRRVSFEKTPERFTASNSFKSGEGIIGKVFESGERLIFEDVEADPRYRQFTRTGISSKFNNRFFAVFPIRSRLQILGTLTCVGTAPRKLAAGETQLLEALADQLAVAIENSGLYEALRSKVDELQRKTTELEQANKVKDDFLSVVSHELRTPMNVIMGYTTLFKDGVLGEIKPAQEDALEKIARESKDLLVMINTLLYATTLENEPSALEVHGFSAENLLAELRANYAVTVPRQVTMHWHYVANLPPMNTDRRKLRQILDNLIGNAVKFTEHGEVTVTASARQAPLDNGCVKERQAQPSPKPWIEFAVRDTGVGIPPDRVIKVFDKFYQVDSSETRRYGGVGMGLYIAKRFVELLGGTIAVVSTEGKGSTFTVTVPCEPASYPEIATDSPANA